MRSIAFMLCLCGLLTTAEGSAPGQGPASPETVQALIERLDSSKFAERERATKELEALGPAVLPALRQAQQQATLESRRRLEILIRRLEDRQLAATLLTGRPVRLKFKDVSVSEAVAELTRQSG